jgi:DNA-directed RNA polymerase specialized sigma24 family protein
VVRAFLERSGENPGAWGEQGRADVHGGTEDGLAPGPAPGGAASGVVAAPDRRGTLALLSALAARPRLAVVLTHLEDLTPGAIGELAGWHLPEVEDLERLGARRLLDEAMREVRQR